MPINQQGYFEEYYPNFEFAQSISRLNPEQFSGVVYDEASGRAVFAPPSQNKPYQGQQNQEGGQEDVTPEQALKKQLEIARAAAEEAFAVKFKAAQNEFSMADIELIDAMQDAPTYKNSIEKLRNAIEATFQKKQMDAHTEKDLEMIKIKEQEQSTRNIWSIIDKKRDKNGDVLTKEAKFKTLGMSGLEDPYAVAQEEAKIRQQASQSVQPSIEQQVAEEKAVRDERTRQGLIPPPDEGVPYGEAERTAIEKGLSDWLDKKYVAQKTVGTWDTPSIVSQKALQDWLTKQIDFIDFKSFTPSKKRVYLNIWNKLMREKGYTNWVDISSINNEGERNKLPSGSTYLAPSGSLRIKE